MALFKHTKCELMCCTHVPRLWTWIFLFIYKNTIILMAFQMEDTPGVEAEGVAKGEAELDYEAGVEVEVDSRGRKSLVCPLCGVPFRATSFWGHINNFHIARNLWPEVSFLKQHRRLVCSTCKFCYDERWVRSGCRRPIGSGKQCCGHLCRPSEVLTPEMSLPPCTETPATLVSSANTPSPSSATVHCVLPSLDPPWRECKQQFPSHPHLMSI